MSTGESRRGREGEVSQLVRTFLINIDDLALDRLGPKACTHYSTFRCYSTLLLPDSGGCFRAFRAFRQTPE